MNYLLYNPLANNNQGEATAKEAITKLKDKFSDLNMVNVIGLDYSSFMQNIKKEDNIILCGGDGTLNCAANILYDRKIICPFYLYKAGTGNDFIRDIKTNDDDYLFMINDYLKNLPIVKINGVETRYINGIGYGLDGTACEVADKLKAKGKKKINYTAISIKLLIAGFHCPSAKVTVDGKEYSYKKVWLASAMKGRYYGGVMDIAPNQDRKGDKLSLVLFHDSGRLRTLLIFPKIFEGKHVKYTKYIDIIEGKHIKVEFSRPNALQIDGETVLNVSSYEAIME